MATARGTLPPRTTMRSSQKVTVEPVSAWMQAQSCVRSSPSGILDCKAGGTWRTTPSGGALRPSTSSAACFSNSCTSSACPRLPAIHTSLGSPFCDATTKTSAPRLCALSFLVMDRNASPCRSAMATLLINPSFIFFRWRNKNIAGRRSFMWYA